MRYKNTTQTPNLLFDHLLKELSESQLKVLLTIIRKTMGQADPECPEKRLERAWISQKLFMLCCSLSGKSVSNAINSLVIKGYIEVTNQAEEVMHTTQQRRKTSRLYYASRLRLEANKKQASKMLCINGVNKCHTIKLRNNIKLYEQSTQPIRRRLTDRERYLQITTNLSIKNVKDT